MTDLNMDAELTHDLDICSEEAEREETSTQELIEEDEDELDMDSDRIHEEVEEMLTATGPEIMELISLDPKYYLNIVQNYKKMRNGKDIYLPDLFNILVRRDNDKLKIKFKLTDNSNWHEVGYDGDTFCDDDVYQAFSDKVTWALKRPLGNYRAVIEETMKDGSGKPSGEPETTSFVASENRVDEPKVEPKPKVIVGQGDQNKLTKIDRYLGRSPRENEPVPYSTSTPASVPAPVPAPTEVPASMLSPTSSTSSTMLRLFDTPEPQTENSDIRPTIGNVSKTDDLFGSLVDSYRKQLQHRLRTQQTRLSLSDKVANLQNRCSSNEQLGLKRLSQLLDTNNHVNCELIELLVEATPGQRILIIDYLKHSASATLTEDELMEKLELDHSDRELIRNLGIDLQSL